MSLSLYEQETIILYNNAEKAASVFTYNKSLIRKLDKKLIELSDIKLIRRGEDFAEYTVPKKWVKVVFPRQYSVEKRAEMIEHMKIMREKQMTRIHIPKK